MNARPSFVRVVSSFLLILSLLLPGAGIFAPSVALAQSDPTPVGG
jgi:hypothetical protein